MVDLSIAMLARLPEGKRYHGTRGCGNSKKSWKMDPWPMALGNYNDLIPSNGQGKTMLYSTGQNLDSSGTLFWK